MYGDTVSMGGALVITIVSMGIVFATLIVISYILSGFKTVFYKEKKETKEPIVNEIIKEETKENNDELVAVIAAAISMSTNKPIDNFYIRNIKRVPQTTPIWGKMGRQEQIYN